MFVNIIKSHRDVVAICDSDLIGKQFEEGNIQLDLKENFYKGKEVSSDELIEIIRNFSSEDATFNIVGKDSVNVAIQVGIISEGDVKKINEIPFAFILM